MCVSHKLRKVDTPLAKKLFIKEKLFVMVIRYPYLLNTILKVFTKNLLSKEETTTIEFDSCLIDIDIQTEYISVENIKVLKFKEPNEKFVFNPTLHVLEQIFERNLKYFDWGILCNIYKEALNKVHIKSYKYEITNNNSTVNYAINNNVISLITAWNGKR